MWRIVLDTNILVSALLSDGPPRKIVKAAAEEKFSFALSPFILDELSGVLIRKKFHFPARVIDTYLDELCALAEMVFPKNQVHIITADPQDNKIIECAIAFSANMIVSGDSHLLQLGAYKDIKIMKATDFIYKLFPE